MKQKLNEILDNDTQEAFEQDLRFDVAIFITTELKKRNVSLEKYAKVLSANMKRRGVLGWLRRVIYGGVNLTTKDSQDLLGA